VLNVSLFIAYYFVCYYVYFLLFAFLGFPLKRFSFSRPRPILVGSFDL